MSQNRSSAAMAQRAQPPVFDGPRKLQEGAHPIVRRLFEEMRAQQIGITAMVRRHGQFGRTNFWNWFGELKAPTLGNLDEAFSILGYRLTTRVIRRRRPRSRPCRPIIAIGTLPVVREVFDYAAIMRIHGSALIRASGLPKPTIYRWARCGFNPRLDNFQRLLDALGLELAVREITEPACAAPTARARPGSAPFGSAAA